MHYKSNQREKNYVCCGPWFWGIQLKGKELWDKKENKEEWEGREGRVSIWCVRREGELRFEKKEGPGSLITFSSNGFIEVSGASRK